MQRTKDYTDYIINQLIHFFGNASQPYLDKEIYLRDDGQIAQQLNCPSQVSDIRYHYIYEFLGSELLILTFHLAVAQYQCAGIDNMIRSLTGRGVCLSLAKEMLDQMQTERTANTGIHDLDAQELYEGYEKLTKILCISDKKVNDVYTELIADKRLMLYLNGSNTMMNALKGMAYVYLGQQDYDLYGYEDQQEKLIGQITNINQKEYRGYIQIAAATGGGRKSIIKKAADILGFSVVFVDYERWTSFHEEEQKKMLPILHRELLFYDAAVCFYQVEAGDAKKNVQKLFYLLEREFDTFANLVFLVTLSDTEVIPHTHLPFVKLELPYRALEQRVAVWRGYSEKYGIPLDAQYYGSKYGLTPGQVCKIFTALNVDKTKAWAEDELEQVICRASMDVISMPERGSIVQSSNGYRLEDIQLPDIQKTELYSICAYMKNYYKVFSQWGMEQRFQYGKGLTALFVGTPGTGKTMAASCIANELGLPLYKVDLSQVVDKYIGETEKKLEVIFQYAETANVVLFFDEADALFGKRSEIKEAKDKYANTEVSYILQRIEQHDGMVILASNFINNIDEAFMRRMKYVIEFQMPDISTRKMIWKNVISMDVPLGTIDYEYLSEKIELSGGHIKNIVLSAAFMAAQNNEKVDMRYILQSVKREYHKLGKNVSAEEFEEYAYCMKS